MPTVEDWKRLKRRYQNLKTNASAVLTNLDNCKSLISNAEDKFSVAIILDDDSSLDNGKFEAMSDSINDMAYKLRNKVIPALTNKIRDINSEIEKAESEE